jgi:hypothetical protein
VTCCVELDRVTVPKFKDCGVIWRLAAAETTEHRPIGSAISCNTRTYLCIWIPFRDIRRQHCVPVTAGLDLFLPDNLFPLKAGSKLIIVLVTCGDPVFAPSANFTDLLLCAEAMEGLVLTLGRPRDS